MPLLDCCIMNNGLSIKYNLAAADLNLGWVHGGMPTILTKAIVSIPSGILIRILSQLLGNRLHTHLSTTPRASGCSILHRPPSTDRPSTSLETPPLRIPALLWPLFPMLLAKQS